MGDLRLEAIRRVENLPHNVSVSRRKWQLSHGCGSKPRWRGDGSEILYLVPTGMLMAAPVDAAGTFLSGEPTPLFQVRGRAPISSTDLFTLRCDQGRPALPRE